MGSHHPGDTPSDGLRVQRGIIAMDRNELMEHLMSVQEAFKHGDYKVAEDLFESHPELSRMPEFNIIELFIQKRREAMIRNGVMERSTLSQEAIGTFGTVSSGIYDHVVNGTDVPEEETTVLKMSTAGASQSIDEYRDEMEGLRGFLEAKVEKWESDPYHEDPDRSASPWTREDIDECRQEMAICDSVIKDSVITQTTVNTFHRVVNNVTVRGGIPTEEFAHLSSSLTTMNEQLSHFSQKVAESERIQEERLHEIVSGNMQAMFQNFASDLYGKLQEKDRQIEELMRKQEAREQMLIELLQKQAGTTSIETTHPNPSAPPTSPPSYSTVSPTPTPPSVTGAIPSPKVVLQHPTTAIDPGTFEAVAPRDSGTLSTGSRVKLTVQSRLSETVPVGETGVITEVDRSDWTIMVTWDSLGYGQWVRMDEVSPESGPGGIPLKRVRRRKRMA